MKLNHLEGGGEGSAFLVQNLHENHIFGKISILFTRSSLFVVKTILWTSWWQKWFSWTHFRIPNIIFSIISFKTIIYWPKKQPFLFHLTPPPFVKTHSYFFSFRMTSLIGISELIIIVFDLFLETLSKVSKLALQHREIFKDQQNTDIFSDLKWSPAIICNNSP